ncbi:uncharacterized protein LOC126742020 [Anthonomus grandis grandis]|uniref:uncharacterized protein LOC126742020 n=1 Tax=Anthonomus grandis grandis TaxID=2921223 RepID=UPI0021668AF9|nr:uncharacterized protein LOC126742020 [Anthonomus grandis grandis]
MNLSRIFCLNSVKSALPTITRCFSTQIQTPRVTFVPPLNPWIYQRNDKIKTPISSTIISRIDLPNGLSWVPPLIEPLDKHEIIAPTTETAETPKEAVRMIVIRRKKMKKHKLKKLRKRMKFENAKRRQRREMKKEKEFQAVLIQQCKQAEAFSAEEYVNQKLDKLHEIVIPRYWKGKRLPEFLIRQKMGLPPK